MKKGILFAIGLSFVLFTMGCELEPANCGAVSCDIPLGFPKDQSLSVSLATGGTVVVKMNRMILPTDRVYFMLEDSRFGYELHPKVSDDRQSLIFDLSPSLLSLFKPTTATYKVEIALYASNVSYAQPFHRGAVPMTLY